MNLKTGLLYLFFIPLILFNIYLSSYSAVKGEVNFFNDVGRDFLLLEELDEKKLVFIGPRSNTNNLFHGPLWTYVNYPAYLMGDGNPVFQAWFWIFIEVVFLATSFYVARKMFGTLPGLFYALFLSTKLIPHINGVFHSEATFFMMPVLFYSVYEYLRKKRVKFLVLHLISLDVMIQLNIGVGLPFTMLSIPVISIFIIKKKLWKHFWVYVVTPLGLINLIIFDIKHNFMMVKALLGTGGATKLFVTLNEWIQNRIENIISLELFENYLNLMPLLLIIFTCVMVFSISSIKNRKDRALYLLFFFYYFGYIFLSVFNKGILLFHYIYVLIPLTILWIVSFLRGKYIAVFLPIVMLIYALNFQFANSFIKNLDSNFINKNANSWVGLADVARFVLNEQKGKEFGYFVFAPDAFAYQPRYAMLYNFKNLNVEEYVKKKTTYVIAQGAPVDNPLMDYRWWVKVPVGIAKKPILIKKFPNGYTVLKYTLDTNEQKIPHDKAIELDIHFR